ncbi:MAG: LysR family transcriptional regulator [Rhodospirillales bacterium]|nr:LysR family transcriptional regulator [Rhodospirillales bacterium]
MVRSLPFSSLRVFEAVVRLEGFGRAAEELGVSQGAVSQHVRALEEWLGQKLLVRGPRRSRPTDRGALLAEAIATGIDGISRVCDRMFAESRETRTITISCLPGFAINWLFPRLIDFDERHPEYSVSIATTSTLATFTIGGEDAAIRYGLGDYPKLHVEKLMGERLFPVCAPSLVQRGLRGPADIRHHTLLVDDVQPAGSHAPTWAFWQKATGETLPPPARSRRFGQSNMVVQAAIKGLGVALGREPLVIDALRDGSLCRPFGEAVMSEFAYWFVCPPAHLETRHVRAFRSWLLGVASVRHALPDIARNTTQAGRGNG